MPNIQFEYPHVITVEGLQPLGADNLKNNQDLVSQVLQSAYRGVVTKDGKWAKDKYGNVLSPGEWKIEKLDEGSYKINHNLGFTNTSLNLTLFQSPGSFTIVEHTIMYFTVYTTLDGKACDMPFAFTLIKAISP